MLFVSDRNTPRSCFRHSIRAKIPGASPHRTFSSSLSPMQNSWSRTVSRAFRHCSKKIPGHVTPILRVLLKRCDEIPYPHRMCEAQSLVEYEPCTFRQSHGMIDSDVSGDLPDARFFGSADTRRYSACDTTHATPHGYRR